MVCSRFHQPSEETIVKCHAYLSFDGNCEEALRFYEEALGAKMVNMMHFAGTPMAEHAPQD